MTMDNVQEFRKMYKKDYSLTKDYAIIFPYKHQDFEHFLKFKI